MGHPLEDRTRYDPGETEARIFARWFESGRFHPDPAGTAAENYSIAIPPPNVTGALHMGHALNGSIQDALIRYARMRGKRTKWILGTDHAGIATQTQVERLLKSEGTTREQIGREAFVERVWRWRAQYGGTIIGQFKRLGASVDYEEERFTLDEGYVRAVLRVFVALYEKGLIYRDNYMVNWDPGSGSAISDLEVEDREVTDTLYYVDYPLASGNGSITVATVRPETMLGDTAIAVHPHPHRRAPRRRPLHATGGGDRDPAGRRPPPADHRRRLRQARVRHRRVEDHARTRPERLRDRPQARPRRADGDRRGRPHDRCRRRALRGPDRARGARGGRARAARGGPDQPHRALHARGPVLAALGRADRAADLAAVVHEDAGAGRAGDRGGRGRPRAHPPRGPAPPLSRVAQQHPPVVHLPPALVGPPDPGLVPRRRDLRGDRPARRPRLAARSRRARHVVLLRPVAVRHARLAGPHR